MALWHGLQQTVAQGLVRSIGVSNYSPAELAALQGAVPAVNQCEMSIAAGHDDAAIAWGQSHSPPIVYESYHGMKGCPTTDAALIAIAKAHSKSTYQVCLRWVLDRGAILAVGTGSDPSTAGAYAKENLDIYDFTLTAAEVATLDAIGK